MSKMAVISYNEAIDSEVMAILNECALKNYTKVLGAFGRGTTSGIHLGNDIWPGRNNILCVACENQDAKKLLAKIKDARKTLGKEGIKAFILPIEELS